MLRWLEGFGSDPVASALASKYPSGFDPGGGLSIAPGRLPGTSCWIGGTVESSITTGDVNPDDATSITVSLRMRANEPAEFDLISIIDEDDFVRLVLRIIPTGGGWMCRVAHGAHTIGETRVHPNDSSWRLIEFGVVLDPDAGAVTLRIDTQTLIETTNATTTDGTARAKAIKVSSKKASPGGSCDIQDIAIWSGDSFEFNGPIAIYPAFPKSIGTLNEFDAFVGGDDAFESVDEPGNDEGSTWIESATEGQRQTFGVGGPEGTSDVGYGSPIGVMVGAHMNLDAAGSRSARVVMGPTGAVVESGDAIGIDGSGWVYAFAVTDKSAADTAISRSDVSDLEFGVETLVTGGSGTLLLSSVHAEIAIVEPASFVGPEDLPTVLANILRANWATDPEVESAWLTDKTRSPYTGAVDCRSLRDRPIRTQTVRLTALNGDASYRLISNLMRRQRFRGPVPLYSDKAGTTDVSSGSTIPCDTRWKRFYPGARVMIHAWSEDGIWPIDPQIRTIETLSTDAIEVSPDLDGSFPKGSRVYPLIDCEIETEDTRTALTDSIVDARVSATEVVGQSALPSSEPAALPDGFEVIEGLPVLDIEANWSDGIDVDVIGGAQSDVVGRGPVVTIDGAPTATSPKLSFRFLSREKWWRFLRFFDAMRGGCGAFLFASPESLLSVVSADGPSGRIVVSPTGNFDDVSSLAWVAIRIRNAPMTVRKVASVEIEGDSWVITTIDPLPFADETSIRRISRGHIGMFESDAVVEEWRSDQIVDINDVSIVEIPTASPVSIENTKPVPSQWGTKVPKTDLYLWVDSSKNTWYGNDASNPQQRVGFSFFYPNQYVDWWDDARFDAAKYISIGTPPQKPHLRRDDDFSENGPVITRFTAWKKNYGRPIVEMTKGSSGAHRSRFVLENDLAPFWSETGFTIIVCARLRTSGSHTFFSRAGVVEWTHNQVTIGADVFSTDDLRRQSKETYVLKWTPGVQARVWLGGKQKGITGTVPSFAGLDPDPALADPTLLCDFDPASTEQLADEGVGVNCFVSSILIYQRGLDESEIDEVGRFLKRQFGAPWKDLT